MDEIISNDEEQLEEPAKVEKVSLTEIAEEKQHEAKEKTETLVKKIMDKILEIK